MLQSIDATVSNPHIDRRLQLALNSPDIQQINQKLKSYHRNRNLLKTDAGMKEYNSLLLDKDTRLNVLQNEENQKI